MGPTIIAGTNGALEEACGAEPGLVCDWVFQLTENPGLARFADWFVAKPLKIVLILLVAYVVSRLIQRSIKRLVTRVAERPEPPTLDAEAGTGDPAGRLAALRSRAMATTDAFTLSERRRQRAQALGMVLRSIASLVIFALAIMIILAEFGISLGPLVAGAGVIGIALGFGAQSLVRDFLSGIFMLIEDQYGVGDVVDLGDATGVVEEVSLRTTRLRDVEGTVWFVPNGEIRRVGNKSQGWARAVLDVEVAYDTNLDHASEVIKRVADELWQGDFERFTVLEEPEVVGVQALGDSAIAIRVMLKVGPGEQFATSREMRRRIKDAFEAERIDIPFPQQVIWTRTDGVAGEDT
jgi:small conductance mechanosensitive channel